ncbi:malto-oligosyltrehalose synthase [Candidatus Methylomirabilis sp.]|uniref:malto-oligosyltrehalose synthase n=1 Tax=Candidatus Methylomirabilis sp. TaxID=2032687 RepID=UPI003C7164E2
MATLLVVDEIFDGILKAPSAIRRVPVATYRLQFQPVFTFDDAKHLVPYLHELGISDCYVSPILQAASSNSHGYDISHHNLLNPELGAERGFNEFVGELKRHEMGLILDWVPNHMGISGNTNAWWLDVLENGPSSPHARFFDIDWTPVKAELTNKVLLPVLGDQYGKVLENQDLRLAFQEGAFSVWYQHRRLPIDPGQYIQILQHRLDVLADLLDGENVHFLELQSILTALGHLPPTTETDPEKVIERQREKEIIKKRLAKLSDESEDVRRFIEENVRIFNGKKEDPRSFDLLDTLLAAQVYRVAFWRVAGEEINYRRFFDINELAAIRMEHPDVFQETHQLIFRLIREGKVSGLRIDHPDGLYEPTEYFRRLQRGVFLAACRNLFEPGLQSKGSDWKTDEEQLLGRYDEEFAKGPQSPLRRAFYIIAEKILTREERLPDSWAVDGTTGYDFLNQLNGIFVDSSHGKSLEDVYSRFTTLKIHFQHLAYEKKRLIMQVSMSSEINVLGHQLNRISEKNRLSRDFTLYSLTDALREIIACFPVYRTYVCPGDVSISDDDRIAIYRAVAKAKRRNPTTNVSIFDFIRDILCLRFPEYLEPQDQLEARDFVMKFQQCTGPVMAKGVEDTAFYIYNRLLSLNEVGGDPEEFGVSLTAFHEGNAQRREAWPYSLLTTSTHDTKRSEDVRARINVLSEIPSEWKVCLSRWGKLNKKKKLLVDDQLVPDRNDEYLLYQSLLGAWPLEPMDQMAYKVLKERIHCYMEKATKEAKVNTSWVNPSKAYDDAVQAFADSILDDSQPNPFLDDFKLFQRRVATYGIYNSISQTLLKLTSPGVPDIYQGNETWDFSLVDPDNRRPVDYGVRRQMLKTLKDRISGPDGDLVGLVRELLKSKEDGRIKLFITWMALNYRRAHQELFLEGDYLFIEGRGSKKDHICAFARKKGDQHIVVVAPRFFSRLLQPTAAEIISRVPRMIATTFFSGLSQTPEELPIGDGVWGDSTVVLPDGRADQRYRNVLTGEAVAALEHDGEVVLPLSRIFASFPVALLERSM